MKSKIRVNRKDKMIEAHLCYKPEAKGDGEEFTKGFESRMADGLGEMMEHLNDNFNASSMSMVEIGSFCGYSSFVFANFFDCITCIDPYLPGYDDKDGSSDEEALRKAHESFNKFVLPLEEVALIELPSSEAHKFIKEDSLDFVYIDGNHGYEAIKQDIINWLPKIKDGGFIGGHDYRWVDKGNAINNTQRALYETIGTPEWVFGRENWLTQIY